MNFKCYFQYDDGSFCKLWAMHGSRFCQNHQPPDAQGSSRVPIVTTGLAPVPIRNPRDIFRILSDALNGLRTGAVSPGRAYATACLARLWLEQYGKLKKQADAKAKEKELYDRLRMPAPPEPAYDFSPDPDPDPSATAQVTAAPSSHDPWAAGRMAGLVPVEASPPAPISLEQAEAKLREAMGWKHDSRDEPLGPTTSLSTEPPPALQSTAQSGRHERCESG